MLLIPTDVKNSDCCLGNFYPPSSNCKSEKTMFCHSNFLSSRTIQMEGNGECDLLDFILVVIFSSCKAFYIFFFFFKCFSLHWWSGAESGQVWTVLFPWLSFILFLNEVLEVLRELHPTIYYLDPCPSLLVKKQCWNLSPVLLEVFER